jgi:long-chain acyl-CoA synthetase
VANTTTAPEKLGEVAESVPELILERVNATPNDEAFRAPHQDDTWRTYTWQQFYDDVEKLAAGLLSLGLELEHRVAIAANTSMDWVLADHAVMMAGGATTTVYASTKPEDVAYILTDSHSRIAFVEDDKQVAKLREIKDQIPDLAKVIAFGGTTDGDWVISMDELRGLGEGVLADNPQAVKQRAAEVKADDLATLIYTSGTTGKPKGVELLHSCWAYEGAAMRDLGIFTKQDVQFLWLPLAHSFGKVLLMAGLTIGMPTAVDGRLDKIIVNLPVVKPTFSAMVPRLLERIYSGVADKAHEEGGAKAKIFDWAYGVGIEAATKELNGENVGGILALKRGLADRLVFSKVRERFGGRMRYFASGSAALSKDIALWFYATGITVLEGYGLTETSAASCVGRPDNYALGKFVPLPGTEIKIAHDGEILVRGAGVMRAYRHLEEATAEVFPGEDWFATGDIGDIDEHGRVRITDRKKDLVKTSGGKYIAPSAIESQFKAECGLAANMVVHANERKFASALITLDPDKAAAWAAAHGKAGASLADLSKDSELRAEIQSAVDALNAKLNRWETIKKFEILDRDFTVEDGELTPSLKVKRKVVEEKNRDILDAMYT